MNKEGENMRKRSAIILLLLIALCIGAFFGYRTVDAMKTDTKAPEIKVDGTVPQVSVKDPKSALLQGITATDNKDGNVTDSLVVESVTLLDSDGSLEVSCAAFDRAGNVAKAVREAQYTDYQSPKFTLSGPLAYPYTRNFDVMTTVGATDVIEGDIQHRVRATSLEDESIADMGSHNVQFQVTNALGDTTSCIFPVEVYDPEIYDATLSLTDYLVYVPEGGTFTPKSYLEEFVFRGEETDLTRGMPADYTLKTKGEVLTNSPGVYPVEFRVIYTMKHETDPERDQSFTGYSKMIVIVEG